MEVGKSYAFNVKLMRMILTIAYGILYMWCCFGATILADEQI